MAAASSHPSPTLLQVYPSRHCKASRQRSSPRAPVKLTQQWGPAASQPAMTAGTIPHHLETAKPKPAAAGPPRVGRYCTSAEEPHPEAGPRPPRHPRGSMAVQLCLAAPRHQGSSVWKRVCVRSRNMSCTVIPKRAADNTSNNERAAHKSDAENNPPGQEILLLIVIMTMTMTSL